MPAIETWAYWALLAAVFAALTAIFAKIGVENVDPDLATLIRTVVILLMLVAIVSLTGKWQGVTTLPPRAVTFLCLSALTTGASWLFYFRALQAGEASRVAPIDKLSVVFVAVFAFVFLGERPRVHEWVGIALVAIGAMLLAVRR